MIEALAAELGSARAALSLLCLRLGEAAGFLAEGTCAALGDGASATRAGRELRDCSRGALPPWRPPRNVRGPAARALLDGRAPEPLWFALCASAERLFARKLGEHGRRAAGVYYTPPELADEVVALALKQGSVRRPDSVLDPCAGAGAFLCAAARAIPRARFAGADLDPDALRIARASLALCRATTPDLVRADSLRTYLAAPDLIVSNPPYGHVADAHERRRLLARFPALRGGEIDRYAAFLLRSLELIRPGGTAALLVPDTWMTNSRSGPLRKALLDGAEIAAVCDLGKPFAAAKDTRVQAVVLVRRASARTPARATRVLRGRNRLADAPEPELRAAAGRGWQIYRSDAERRLCAAMEAAAVPLAQVCSVGYGLRTGENARFVARRPPEPGEIALVGGEDVVPFALRLHAKALRAPTEPLRALARRQLGRPRICIQRIRTNSRVPHARWLEAAFVSPDLVCLDSLSTVASHDEELLWAVLGLLNSVALQRYHRLRTTDVNVKPALLRELPVPRVLLQAGGAAGLATLARARAAEASLGSRASVLSPRAALARAEAAPALERAVDAEVYASFGLSEPCQLESERGFWGPRFEQEFPRLAQECRAPRVA